MTKFLPTEIVHTDVLTAGPSRASGSGMGPKLDVRRAKLRLNENAETNRQYIGSCFGRSLYPPEELAAAEQQFCTGNHLGCHLWFTAGVPDPKHAHSGESRLLTKEAVLQVRRNRDAFSKGIDLYQNAILRLSEQIRGCIQIHSQTEAEAACSDRLDSPRAWRAAVWCSGTGEQLFEPPGLYSTAGAEGLCRQKRQPEDIQLFRLRLEPGRTGSPGSGRSAEECTRGTPSAASDRCQSQRQPPHPAGWAASFQPGLFGPGHRGKHRPGGPFLAPEGYPGGGCLHGRDA